MAMNKYVSSVKYSHYTHIRKAHEWLHHFTKRNVWAKINSAIFFFRACIKSGWSCIYVLGALILHFSTIFIFDFWNVPMEWYFVVFHFITTIIKYLPRRSNTTWYTRHCVDFCPAIDMHAFWLWTIEYFLSYLKIHKVVVFA
jgi:hypothetical protein